MRRRSETRQRTEIIAVRVTPEERAKIASAAARYDRSLAEVLRAPLCDLVEFGGYK